MQINEIKPNTRYLIYDTYSRSLKEFLILEKYKIYLKVKDITELHYKTFWCTVEDIKDRILEELPAIVEEPLNTKAVLPPDMAAILQSLMGSINTLGKSN